ncbi:MAG: hypothetical protein QHJ73_13440, partial [Armatimonadota bacterium]|nr:hypothetical protein [Armatimonadota bacterium]
MITMCRNVPYLFLAIAPLVLPACTAAPEKAVDDARAAEIAAMLPEHPAGVGRPAADRAFWNRLAALPEYRALVARAERLLTEPLPPYDEELYLEFSRNGNRTRYQNAEGRRRGRLTPLVLAECVENKGRFVKAFEELVESLAAERTWVLPAHDARLTNFHGTAIDIDLASSALA